MSRDEDELEDDSVASQQRHKAPSPLERPREVVVACAPMHSHVNLSRIVRAAGCCAVERLIACGPAKIDRKIARDGADTVTIETHRTLAPALKHLRAEGYRIVGLEQTDRSVPLYGYAFPRRAVIVVGNERAGLEEDAIRACDDLVEIPVYGRPFAHNAATAAAIALYEYCRQHPQG